MEDEYSSSRGVSSARGMCGSWSGEPPALATKAEEVWLGPSNRGHAPMV